jgi:hypothetical protein
VCLKKAVTSGGLDNDRMSVYDERNKVAESLTELIRSLQAGEKGKGQSKDQKLYRSWIRQYPRQT